MASNAALKKVFFIDDDKATNAYHKGLAQNFNLAEEVSIFDNAEDALKLLAAVKSKQDFPDLIFLDIIMPKVDGHEFVKQIRELETFDENRTRVVLLTSSKAIDDVVTADENDVSYYYWKPLDEALLKKILKEGFGI
ncbi:response regulator [Bacteroidota bacterium]